LARRYFQSHGPATPKDFGWWSGLTAADVKLGLEAIKSGLEHEIMNGNTYWFIEPAQKVKSRGSKAYFLPNYDEYTVGYTDRSAIFDLSHSDKLDSRGSVLSQHVVLTAGHILASWKRTLKAKSLSMEAKLFETLTQAETHAMVEAAERYASFLGLPFELTFQESEGGQ
jgi:hypothetical protein